MPHLDEVLTDGEIVTIVYEAWGSDAPRAAAVDAMAAAAEMVRWLLVLKHIRNWSYETLEREVRANLMYRDLYEPSQAVIVR
jgi:IS5 family transposase